MTMTPKEELIQTIERSPDDLVRAILELLKVWQRQQSQQMLSSHFPKANASQSKYDFSDLAGRLTWRGNAVAVQKELRDEW
jgi:hypothetical protein